MAAPRTRLKPAQNHMLSTFAQTLSEASNAAKKTLLVVSFTAWHPDGEWGSPTKFLETRR